MKTRNCLSAAILLALSTASGASDEDVAAIGDAQHAQWIHNPVVASIRQATAAYRDVNVALAAGYTDTRHCVSSGTGGAMGVHLVNLALMFDDGTVDIATPEILVYEPLANGKLRLVGVEYFSVDDGDPSTGSPVLAGHLLSYAGSPNRYGLPPFHELHVWAWKYNPDGTFADWNPRVKCDAYDAVHAVGNP